MDFGFYPEVTTSPFRRWPSNIILTVLRNIVKPIRRFKFPGEHDIDVWLTGILLYWTGFMFVAWSRCTGVKRSGDGAVCVWL